MSSAVQKEKETSMWVRQNLIKVGKMFGVEFQGHEEESLELLMQIGSCRHAMKMESDSISTRPRYKGVQELKMLTSCDINFKCEEKRERWGKRTSFIMNAKLLSWNVRGLNSGDKRRFVKSLISN